MALAAGALTIGLLPAAASAAGPDVTITTSCDGPEQVVSGGPELIREFWASLKTDAYDGCATGYVNLRINDRYIYGVDFS